MLARKEPLPDGYLVGIVRRFAYSLAGVETIQVTELEEQQACGFLVCLQEYQAYAGTPSPQW